MILKCSNAFNEYFVTMWNDVTPVFRSCRIRGCLHELEVRRIFICDDKETATVMFDAVFHTTPSWRKNSKRTVGVIRVQCLPLPGERGMGQQRDVRLCAGLVEE